MADPFVAERTRGASPEASALALAHFAAASAEVRGSAILGPDGVLAASGSEARWAEAGQALLEAADAAAGGTATHAHVATEEGEVFAVRSGELAIVAVTSRYTLASLVFADLRAALRGARERAVQASAEAA
jgi:predicted regulator of Ras-like GTPase activity (Roadblock/LC7/MglB family)